MPQNSHDLADVLGFVLPEKYKPGGDPLSRIILRNSFVIDLIVTEIIGHGAKSNYSHKAIDWADGTRTDVYVSSTPSFVLPPVIVAVHDSIDSDTIHNTIADCLRIHKEYNVLPAVVLFGVQESDAAIQAKLQDTRRSFMKGINCVFWASRCFILDRNTISDSTTRVPFQPLVSLEYFFHKQRLSLMAIDHHDDPTLQSLYGIAKNYLERTIQFERTTTDVLLEVCDQVYDQFTRISDVVRLMPESILKKRTRDYVDDGMMYVQTFKRKYARDDSRPLTPMPPPSDLPDDLTVLSNDSQESSPAYTARSVTAPPCTDMDFVVEFKRDAGKNMNWKSCYAAGSSRGYFRKYKNHGSLKSAYYKNLKKQ